VEPKVYDTLIHVIELSISKNSPLKGKHLEDLEKIRQKRHVEVIGGL
jgi:Trk K+ transport system NAD-binding subunit